MPTPYWRGCRVPTCTCTERFGFSHRARHARRSACGSSPSSYPAGSPRTRRFSRDCPYRATDARQVAGDACRNPVESRGVHYADPRTTPASEHHVELCLSIDHEAARTLGSHSLVLERIQFPDAIIRKLALPACGCGAQISEIFGRKVLYLIQGENPIGHGVVLGRDVDYADVIAKSS